MGNTIKALDARQYKTARLEAALRDAQTNGLLGWFNQEYRRRRLAAVKESRSFMSYTVAHRKLRSAMAVIIAKGGARALGDRRGVRALGSVENFTVGQVAGAMREPTKLMSRSLAITQISMRCGTPA